MGKRTDLTPVSREPSTLLRFAPGFFQLSGELVAGLSLATLAATLVGSRAFTLAIAPYAFRPLAALSVAVGMLWTGHQLAQRNRASGWGAVFVAGTTLIDQLTRAEPSAPGLAFGFAGLVLVAAIWDELE